MVSIDVGLEVWNSARFLSRLGFGKWGSIRPLFVLCLNPLLII